MMLFFDGGKKGRKKYRVERSADIFDADIGPSFFSRSLTFARTFEKTTRFPGFDTFLAAPRSSRRSEKVPAEPTTLRSQDPGKLAGPKYLKFSRIFLSRTITPYVSPGCSADPVPS